MNNSVPTLVVGQHKEYETSEHMKFVVVDEGFPSRFRIGFRIFGGTTLAKPKYSHGGLDQLRA